MAKYSEAQKRAVKKYNEKTYDDIKVRVPKGKKDIYKEKVKERGISLNKFILDYLEKELS